MMWVGGWTREHVKARRHGGGGEWLWALEREAETEFRLF